MRALIVDDEPLARENLRLLLAEFPDVTVAGECRTGREAVGLIPALRPDVVFLDIRGESSRASGPRPDQESGSRR
jgi:two-component system LytT family response regulator